MVEVQRQKAKSLETSFEARRQQIAASLPSHMDPERMMRLALTAAVKNPKLYECSQSSIMLSVLNAAALGTDIDGYHAHLVPYNGVCQLIVDYKGWVDLVYRSNQVERISAHVVRSGDKFLHLAGTEERIEHVPNGDLVLDDPKQDEANYTHAYACGWIKGAKFPVFVVLNRSQVMRRKAVSKSSGSSHSPWNQWPEEMWKKTALRALVKLLPTSTELRNLAEIESKTDMGQRAMVMQEFAPLIPDDEPEEPRLTRKEEVESKLANKRPPKNKPAKPAQQPDPEPEGEVDEYAAESDRCGEEIASCKTLDDLQAVEEKWLSRWSDDRDFSNMIKARVSSRRKQLTPAKAGNGSLLPEDG